MLNRGPHLCVLVVLDVRQIHLTGEERSRNQSLSLGLRITRWVSSNFNQHHMLFVAKWQMKRSDEEDWNGSIPSLGKAPGLLEELILSALTC